MAYLERRQIIKKKYGDTMKHKIFKNGQYCGLVSKYFYR